MLACEEKWRPRAHRADRVLMRDHVPVRVDFRIGENHRDSIFETLKR
jgi:hypothetical protein